MWGTTERYTVVAECVSDGSPLLASTFTFSKILKYNGTRSPAAQQFMPRLDVDLYLSMEVVCEV